MIDLTGKWKGWYAHNSRRITKLKGVDKTAFVINITQTNGNKFTGTVEDEMESGGMEGIGTIEGEWKANTIKFIKKMPYRSSIMGHERIINKSKRHPKIYYTGTINKDKSFNGTWKFKPGFMLVGKTLAFRLPINGTWQMEKEQQ